MSQFRSLVFLAAAIAATACTTSPSSPPPQTSTSTVTVTPPASTEAAPAGDPAGQPAADPAGQPVADPAGQPVAEPGKRPAAAAPADPSAAPGFVTCTDRADMCTKEYKPVCGVVDTGIRCIRAPCPSTAEQTFGNACEACADKKTSGYRAGACATPGPQGTQADVK